MPIVQIGGLVVVVLSLGGLGWILFRLMQNIGYLVEHERMHCQQLGELQQHVAALARVLHNATAEPLPRALVQFAAQVLDD